MIKKIMILLSVMLLLVGCQTNEVPPSPDSPGGVAGEYSVAVDELGNWANEAVGFELSNDMIQVIPVRSAYAQGKILESEAWAWKTVYIYNFNSETWYEEEIDAEIYKNTNWINVQNPIRNGNNIDTLTFYPGLNSLESKYDGENIIAIYSCAKESNSFDCHGGWQVEGFDVNYYFVQDVNVSVDITGTQESSIIELSLPEKLPENIEISITPIVNNFETVTSERVEKTNEGYVISADWSDDQRTFVLPVVWDYEGEYDLEVSVYGIQSNKPGQTVNAFGDISLSLPDMPGAIGGEELEQEFSDIISDFTASWSTSEEKPLQFKWNSGPEAADQKYYVALDMWTTGNSGPLGSIEMTIDRLIEERNIEELTGHESGMKPSHVYAVENESGELFYGGNFEYPFVFEISAYLLDEDYNVLGLFAEYELVLNNAGERLCSGPVDPDLSVKESVTAEINIPYGYVEYTNNEDVATYTDSCFRVLAGCVSCGNYAPEYVDYCQGNDCFIEEYYRVSDNSCDGDFVATRCSSCSEGTCMEY